MGLDLDRHEAFRAWTDPITGVTSHVLVDACAPVQMSFPGVNPCLSADERWLWFVTRHPPAREPTLGAIRLDDPGAAARHFPQAGFGGIAPLVAPEGDAVFFCAGPSVYRLSVQGHVSEVCALPADYLDGRHLWRLATHLSRSCDGRYLLLDGSAGNQYFVALADLASGEVSVIKEFQAHHGCAQFSPVDPERILIAQLPRVDPITGHRLHEDLRPHLLDIHGRNYHCIAPHVTCGDGIGIAHEWWLANGEVAYVDFESGIWRIDQATHRHVHLWDEALCHGHADASRRYWCADRNSAQWDEHPCAVLFHDARRGRTVAIDSGMPTPIYPRRRVHVSPSPHFSPRGTWVVYTTTRRGGVDVALAPVRDILEAEGPPPALAAEVPSAAVAEAEGAGAGPEALPASDGDSLRPPISSRLGPTRRDRRAR